MAKAELIQKYFPTLTDTQLRQFEQLDFASLPVYIYKSNTARRLRNLVTRLFPDRNSRSISLK